MKPPLTLTNPTDDQINAAVAEHVAGWRRAKHCPCGEPDCPSWEHPDGSFSFLGEWTRSTADVLPLLEQYGEVDMIRSGGKWQVVIHTPNPGKYFADGYAYSLPRAACLALLRAHGVGVVGG